MAELRCYHHSNCEDRPAVAKCTKCGKGLCRECADKLRSEDTGDILCVDCLNKEMAQDVAWANAVNARMKKEMILMIVGFVIGLVAEIVLCAIGTTNETVMMIFFLSFILFLPTLLASFGTIWQAKNYFDFFLFKLIAFLVLCVVSPIMFIVRLVRRAKKRKLMKRFAELQAMKYYANEEYKKVTAQMNTRLESHEEFERKLVLKYGVMLKNNQEEAEKRMAEERAKRIEAENKQREQEVKATELANQLQTATKELAETKTAFNNADRQNKARGRSRDKVASGRRAA